MNLFAQAQTGAQTQQTSPYSMLIMFGLIAVIFYFFLIRTQKKKQKDHKDMVNNVKAGTRILTIGGVYGTITRVLDDRFEIEVDKNTRLLVTKSSISSIIDKDSKTKS